MRKAISIITMTFLAGAIFASAVSAKTAPTCNADGLCVKKEGSVTNDRTWSWNIDKYATLDGTTPLTSVTLARGEALDVTYRVTATAISVQSWNASGTIVVFRNSGPATISGITDELNNGMLAAVACTVDGQSISLPYDLPAGYIMNCSFQAGSSVADPPAKNKVTVESSAGQVWQEVSLVQSLTETDECVALSDTYEGSGLPAQVCAGSSTSFTHTYSRSIGPYSECNFAGQVCNTAGLVTNDTAAEDSFQWCINIRTLPCGTECTLTPGYWKTHSVYGPAPYDDTWVLIGEDARFFFSGKSYYQVLWTPPRGGNFYFILAHAYIAARLNEKNGSDVSAVQPALDAALAYFSDPTHTPANPGGRTLRNNMLYVAQLLDDYNNGLIGPGHCSEARPDGQ